MTGHQELASSRGLSLKEGHLDTGLRGHFRSLQSCRTGANNGQIHKRTPVIYNNYIVVLNNSNQLFLSR